MNTRNNRTDLFRHPIWVIIFSLTAAILWGWAYPLIKLGFVEFGITADMTGCKMLFAGVRFFISGIIILSVARMRGPICVKKKSDMAYMLAFALVNTTFHYAFFYFGLSHCEGARAAILNSLGVFLLVLLACMVFESDRLTFRKVLGCLTGFTGILILNVNTSSASGTFTLLGDGMIVMNAICSAVAGLMTRGLAKRVHIFVATGYSLSIGGVLLILPGLLLNGTLPRFTPLGLLYLFLLICISTLAFTLYNKLLSCNPVGKVAIFNSLIPVVGTLSSCICLHEPFHGTYLVAAVLATTGIYIINKGK